MLKQKLTSLLNKIKNTEIIFWTKVILLSSIIIFIVKFFKKEDVYFVNSPKEFKKAEVYKDKNNEIRSNIHSDVISKELFEQVTDSYKRLLKGRVKIKTVIKYEYLLDTSVKVPITKDTSGKFHMKYSDNYLTLEANEIKKDVGEFKLSLTDTITHIGYVRKRFLRANEEVINLNSKSKYVKITQGTSITRKEPKVLVVIGPQLGYNPFTNKFYGGIGATFNVVSIKSNK